MDKKQLAVLVRNEIRKRGISAREAGREMSVAHTTVARILDEKVVGTDTLLKVAAWLKISSPDVVSPTGLDTDEGVASAIAVLVQAEPALADAFRDLAKMVSRNQLEPAAVREVLRYVTWRIINGQDTSADNKGKGTTEEIH